MDHPWVINEVDVDHPGRHLGEPQERKLSLLNVLRNRNHRGYGCPVAVFELLDLPLGGDAEVLTDPADRHVDGAALRIAGGLNQAL
jgi:hypothetical protein